MIRETKKILREGKLPWYKGERREKGKTSNLECTQSNTETVIVSLIDFQTACKMMSCPNVLA